MARRLIFPLYKTSNIIKASFYDYNVEFADCIFFKTHTYIYIYNCMHTLFKEISAQKSFKAVDGYRDRMLERERERERESEQC